MGYPGNYGIIPRTMLPKAQGGDGDPLDVIVLGQAVPRGSVRKIHVVGVLKLLDNGEMDDKIIAVMADSPLSKATTLSMLKAQFPGVLSITETWFENYKGPGQMVSKGYQDAKKATKIIETAVQAFE